MDSTVIVRLKERRVGAGLSQQALASRAGISRQALSAIEGGHQNPSVQVALGLSRALGCRVEDLFSLEAASVIEVEVEPGVVGLSVPTGRVVLGRVGGRWVAHPLSGADYGPCDGVMVEQTPGLRRARVDVHGGVDRLAGNVLIAGCAPLLGTLARRSGEGASVRWLRASSGRAIELLEAGRAHIAGVHLVDGAEGSESLVRSRFKGERMLVVNLVAWRQGLIVQKGNPLGLRPDDLGRPGLRIAWREEGAGARRLLVRTLEASGERAAPDGVLAAGHMEVAQAVASGAADVGVAIEAAAVAFDLGFIPLSSERFDLILPRHLAEDEAVARVLDAIDSRAFRAEAEAFGGYATTFTGCATQIEPAQGGVG